MNRVIPIITLIALFVSLGQAKKRRLPYTITINADGFSALSFNGTPLASGATQLIDGTWFYEPFVDRNFEPSIAVKTVSQNGNIYTVNHTYSGALSATAVYTYTLSGNDIFVEVIVTNTGASPITIPAFRSPFFLWDDYFTPGAVQSNGLGWNSSHTQSQGTDLAYPSTNVAFGGTYAIGLAGNGLQLNLCTWSRQDPRDKFITIGYGRFGVQGVAIGDFFFDAIPAGLSKTFKFAWRFSESTDWKVLMQGYKNDLRASFPTLPYDLDARPIAQFARTHVSNVRPDNPYGYDDGGTNLNSRFDILAGCQDYISKTVSKMVATNYRGIIFWQPQGEHPRGVKYRPDFDQWFPENTPNIPTLVNGFRNAGLSAGLLARPGDGIFATSPTTDGTFPFSTLQEAIGDINPRLSWALGQGFNALYLDSFITVGYDHALLESIRQVIGSIPTFTEHSTALSLAFSGVYVEMTYSGGQFVIDSKIPILRWLYPDSIVLVLFKNSLPPGGLQEVYSFMFANRYTPLVSDVPIINNGPDNGILAPLIQKYIDAANHWRTVRDKSTGRQKVAGTRQLDIAPRAIATNRQIYDNTQ